MRVFAHGRRDAVVDVNVERVLRRAVLGAAPPAGTQALADALVGALDEDEVWTWNQAVMELGARFCRKRAPRCADCPLLATCAWAGRGEDPAAGTGTSQSRFEGSDRQGRGRIVDAVRAGPLPLAEVATVTGWDDEERAARVVAGLVADGLVRRQDGVLRLPGTGDR